MDSDQFREKRQEINRLLDEIEASIKQKSVRDSAQDLEKAETLLNDLSKQAESEVQERSVQNLRIRLKVLTEEIDTELTQRDAGKKGDCNVAFKLNWNDNNYKAPCKAEAYEFNIKAGRTWCTQPECKCREFGQDVSMGNAPCYESIALKEMFFAAGWDHTTDRHQPRHIHNVKKGRMAILTTRPPKAEEEDRLIVGCLYIDHVLDDPGEETKIFGDKEKSVEVPFEEVKIRFWDYYKNPAAEDVIVWASGLFRYVSDKTVLSILKAIGEQYTDTGRDVDKVFDLIKYYETLEE